MNGTAAGAIENLRRALENPDISPEDREQIEEAIEVWRIAPDAMAEQCHAPQSDWSIRRFLIIRRFVLDYVRPKGGVPKPYNE